MDPLNIAIFGLIGLSIAGSLASRSASQSPFAQFLRKAEPVTRKLLTAVFVVFAVLYLAAGLWVPAILNILLAWLWAGMPGLRRRG